MWISQQNENSQGTTSPQSQKKSGKKTTYDRVGFCFPKTLRVLARRHFQKIQTEGGRISGKILFFHYCKGQFPTKIGITVSKKYGKSHERNYFKRLVREVFRENLTLLPQGIQFNVLPRRLKLLPSKQMILEDFKSFAAALSPQEEGPCSPL